MRSSKHHSLGHSLAVALALASVVATGPRAYAGPTVIRDEMLRDTAITPVLGRGYSIATNTYQSICLKDIVKTKPSYNFNYLFQEMTEDGSVQRSSSTAGSSMAFFYAAGGLGGGAQMSSVRVDEKTQEQWHRHSMLVTILVDVYYNSIDESSSKMSPAAASLLTNKDIPGFFDACGMYYVRSISRQAALMSTFSYETKTTQRDSAFESHVKAAMWAFTAVAGGAAAASSDVSRSSSESYSASNLTIRTIGMGIGKNESVMLISYDMDTFKNAVKGAFQATQPDDVGMVTAIEVAPWVENAEFQNLNKLEPIVIPVLDKDGNPELEPQVDPAIPPKKKTKTIMPYAQKRILTQNSEFLAEADRAARTKLNIYYKAKSCKQRIELDNMIQRQPGKWSFRELTIPVADNPDADMGDNYVVNNRTGADQQKVSWLYGMLSQKNLDLLWMEYDSFIYGGGGVDAPDSTDYEKRAQLARDYLTGVKPPPYPRNLFPGSTRCLDDMVNGGITAISYRSLPSCQRLEELFIAINGTSLEDYCMPSYGPAPKHAGM